MVYEHCPTAWVEPVHAVGQAPEEQLYREGLAWAGHQVEHEPGMFLCGKER